MKINKNYAEEVALKKIKDGECFILENTVYIASSEIKFDRETYERRATMRLSDGNLLWFYTEDMVIPIEAEVTLK